MPDVHELFIKPLAATLEIKAKDPLVLFGDLQDELSFYSEDVLKQAARRIRRSKPRAGYYRDAGTFPTVAECVEWCSEFVPRPRVDPNAESREREEREKRANQRIQSDIGREAAEGGWIAGLWDYYLCSDAEPTATDIHAMKRRALEAEKLMKPGCKFSMALKARRKRLGDLATQGEPVE